MGKLTDDEIRALSKPDLIMHLGLGYPDSTIGQLVLKLDLPSNVDNAKADPLDRATKLVNFVDSELSHHDLNDLKEKLIELRAVFKARPVPPIRPPADPKIPPAPVRVTDPTPVHAPDRETLPQKPPDDWAPPPLRAESDAPRADNLDREGRPFVITLHGIKTRGVWQKDIALELSDAGFPNRAFDFDNFLALQLALPWSRRKKVDWFHQQYNAICTARGITRPSVVAHSFGTYLVARAIQIYDLEFDRVILCGSIVRRNYRWSEAFAKGRVRAVLNDFGGLDFWAWVVQFFVTDAGPSGRFGFKDTAGGKVVQTYHPEFRHSDYFSDRNYRRNWIPFLRGQPTADPPMTALPRNWLPWVVIPVILLSLALLGYFVAWPLLSRVFGGHDAPADQAPRRTASPTDSTWTPVPPRDVADGFEITSIVNGGVEKAAAESRKATGLAEPSVAHYVLAAAAALPRDRLPDALQIAPDLRGALGVAARYESGADAGTTELSASPLKVELWGETVGVPLPPPGSRLRTRLYVLVFPYDEEARKLVASRLNSPDRIFHPVTIRRPGRDE